MDGVGNYLAPLLNLPPRGAYSDAKQVVQQLNLLNARGANMVIYGTCTLQLGAVFNAKVSVKIKISNKIKIKFKSHILEIK